jgi:hypothetical protein
VDDERAKALRPQEGYTRIDVGRFEDFVNGHAIYDSLAGNKKVSTVLYVHGNDTRR